SLAGNGSRGSRCIAEQSHLTEEIPGFELSQEDCILRVVLENNVNPARTDDIHPCSRLVFKKHGFARLILAEVDDLLQYSQLFGCQLAKQRDVLKDIGQRLIAGS